MKRQIISKIFAVALVVLLISAQVVMPASAAPASSRTASFTLKLDRDNSTYDRDETVFATFVVNTGFKDVNGFDFSINYDTNALTYTEKSISFPSGSVSDVSVYSRQIAGVLNIAWESDKSVSIPDGSTIFTLRFKVNSDVKSSIQATAITVKLNSMYTYTASHTFQRFEFSAAAPTATVLIGTAKTLSEVVADAINAIGTVELSDECKSRIENAVNLYYSLPLTQRSKVAESQILFDAMEKYEELLQDSKDGSKKVAEDYLAKYKAIVDIPLDSVKKSDLDAVKDAFNELRKLSLQAQSRLMTERAKLAALLEKIASSGDDPIDPEAEWNEFVKTFGEVLNEFKNENGGANIKSLIKLVTEGKEGANPSQAKDINTLVGKMIGVLDNSEANVDETRKNYAIKEIEKLIGDGGYQKAIDINDYVQKISTPEMIKANRFITQFETILKMSVSDVKASDKIDILIASTALDWMDSATLETIAELTKGQYDGMDAYDKIAALLEAVSTLDDEDDSDDDITTDDDGNTYIDAGDDPAEEIIQETIKTINKNKVIYKTGAGNYILKLARREIGAVVWVLFCLLALSVVIFTTLRIVYHNISKSNRKGI